MPTLKLRFPGGRYHATPWGHYVNEGLIEWPPSPWRLLRALIACGFSSQGWTEIPAAAQQLLNKFASVLPSYILPYASAAHSRHYMPYIEGRAQKTTLVFDTWANVGSGEMVIHWPCELSSEESATLKQLASALGYLGRSESWVEAEMIDDGEVPSAGFNSFPHQEGAHPGREYEQISLMAAIPSDDYESWREDLTQPILVEIKLPETSRRPSSKQLQKQEAQRQQAVAPYPPDLLSCLTKDTIWWKMHGWSQPPGSQRVLYWRRSDSLQVGVPVQLRRPASPSVEVMLLSLTTPSGNRSALPSCNRTLPQAELFHRAVVGRVGKGQRVHCPELTGQDELGRPLQDRHAHAHTLPVDLDRDGRIDHLIVYAKMGLRELAQRAIRTLRRTWTKGGVGDLQLAVVGSGSVEILRHLPDRFKRSIESLLGPEVGACVWESLTPFVAPRFLKARGKNTLVGQINSELASRGHPPAEKIEVLADITRSLRHYVRRRNHGGVSPPADMGYGLRLTFSKPIRGPLLLGYAAHYGMGMFRAMTH